MKKLLLTLAMAVTIGSLGVAPHLAEAKRLGGGKAAGLQRQMPAAPAKSATPPTPAQAPGAQPAGQQAAPAMAGATAAAAAAPAKRSWMGPLAGLAAGIGLAALFSHFGMGEGLANFVMIALLAVAAVVLLRFVMGRLARKGQPATTPMGQMGQMGLAGAAAGAGGHLRAAPVQQPTAQPQQAATLTERSSLGTPTGATAEAGSSGAAALQTGAAALAAMAGPALPEGIDRDDFLRLAKMVFIRLQAANDAGNVDDLRKFTTPELFASLRLDLQERGASTQQTDVVQLDAEIADTTRDGMGQDVVSVRYSGLIREQADAGATPFAELWHLVRPVGGDWAIAGITPL
ncbi:Tim44 domain-containing protein [Aquabacterium sp. OR-4]|uniref:Tim44 domain-containing protein n=1 Tax=Aquabacterium sp. OR-4 TaxID=2978127 RepID=UPI0021B313BE|nr:Tim44-like domain-containing protein [Aquabacterium sp. OR-4]MDT7833903.1 Tim44-like domain-containing protein [Aquabacterium sp. OR-4]